MGLAYHDRRFIGVGAAGGEEGLVQLTRAGLGNPLCQLNHWRRRVERRGVYDPVYLIANRAGDLRDAMPDASGQYPAEEVKILATIQVPDPDAVALGENNGLLIVGDGAWPQIAALKFANIA
jgi:hypothetical protein